MLQANFIFVKNPRMINGLDVDLLTAKHYVGLVQPEGARRFMQFDRAKFPEFAEKSLEKLKHKSVAGNPRPIHGAADVLEILELAW